MKKWEYMWIYVDGSVYVANGERLSAATFVEALNIVGQDGWELVAVLPPSTFGKATQTAPQCCLKRPVAE